MGRGPPRGGSIIQTTGQIIQIIEDTLRLESTRDSCCISEPGRQRNTITKNILPSKHLGNIWHHLEPSLAICMPTSDEIPCKQINGRTCRTADPSPNMSARAGKVTIWENTKKNRSAPALVKLNFAFLKRAPALDKPQSWKIQRASTLEKQRF